MNPSTVASIALVSSMDEPISVEPTTGIIFIVSTIIICCIPLLFLIDFRDLKSKFFKK